MGEEEPGGARSDDRYLGAGEGHGLSWVIVDCGIVDEGVSDEVARGTTADCTVLVQLAEQAHRSPTHSH
ncbi:hypothetical protein GCM10009847_02480 [Leucobacter tardus]